MIVGILLELPLCQHVQHLQYLHSALLIVILIVLLLFIFVFVFIFARRGFALGGRVFGRGARWDFSVFQLSLAVFGLFGGGLFERNGGLSLDLDGFDDDFNDFLLFQHLSYRDELWTEEVGELFKGGTDQGLHVGVQNGGAGLLVLTAADDIETSIDEGKGEFEEL